MSFYKRLVFNVLQVSVIHIFDYIRLVSVASVLYCYCYILCNVVFA